VDQHEHEEQAALFQWASYSKAKYPELRWMFAVPNGGYRPVQVAKKLRAEGVKAGVPDIFLPVPIGGYHGLWIEMKYGTNKPTSEQEDWLEYLGKAGYMAVVCYGWDKAKDVVLEYLQEA